MAPTTPRLVPRVSPLFPLILSIGVFGSTSLAGDGPQDAAEFDRFVAEAVGRFGLAGAAVAVVNDGEVVLAKGYGLADCETKVPVTTDTRFNIGSVSKLVAAWGVMRLVDEGRVDLDEPVWKYVRSWELPESEFDEDGVTVRRLLSHTAGLSLHGYPGFALDEPLPTVTESLSGATNGAGAVALTAKPGTLHRYSGGGYTLLQLMCEELTEKPFAEYMDEILFAPLGMGRTGFNRDPKHERGTARPHGYLHDPVPDQAFRAEAAAAAYTTLDDFVKLALAYFDMGEDAPAGAGVLSPDTVALMGSLVPESGGRWAHGPMVLSESSTAGDVVFGHAGDNPGWHALIALHPETRDALIVLTNGDAGPVLRQYLSRPWSAWVGIDPLLPAFLPPAPVAVLGALIEEGGGAAVSEYLRILEEEADAFSMNPRPFSWIVNGLLEAGRAEDALELISLAVDQFHGIPDLWILMARALRDVGDDAGARDACDRALEFAPGHPDAKLLKAELG